MLSARVQQENQRRYDLALMEAVRERRAVFFTIALETDDAVVADAPVTVFRDGSTAPASDYLVKVAGIVARPVVPRWNDGTGGAR